MTVETDIAHARRLLWQATNRRQTSVAEQIAVARTNLGSAVLAFHEGIPAETIRLIGVARRQLIFALTMTRNQSTVTGVVDAISVIDRIEVPQ